MAVAFFTSFSVIKLYDLHLS